MIRKISFILAFLGIVFLVILLSLNPKNISDLENVKLNEKVIFEGVVDAEANFGNLKVLIIEGMGVVCECGQSYLEKNVEVSGVVEEYNNKKQVRALKIKVLRN